MQTQRARRSRLSLKLCQKTNGIFSRREHRHRLFQERAELWMVVAPALRVDLDPQCVFRWSDRSRPDALRHRHAALYGAIQNAANLDRPVSPVAQRGDGCRACERAQFVIGMGATRKEKTLDAVENIRGGFFKEAEAECLRHRRCRSVEHNIRASVPQSGGPAL